MNSKSVQFTNAAGQQLAARLDLPVNQHPHTFALFAHCFTCNKNLTAVHNISRALNLQGIAVLRFDFTGLGESEGDFADTNFSSNVEDLVEAAQFLTKNYQAPGIIIGHSLGGAAVVCAAVVCAAVKAVVTIGAPYDPAHVEHLLSQKIDDIESEGIAEVRIGGRPFTVKKQFLEDIREQSLSEKLARLNKALLILHSPQDLIVSIENAANMYHAARHPKSFITLDGADHLLSNKKDSFYAGDIIACWVRKYINLPEAEKLRSDKQVVVRLGEKGYTAEVMVRHHSLIADEPESVGGNDFGPSPYELVSAGLGTCTAMTLQMYARRKKWPLREVRVHLDHYKDYASDMMEGDEPQGKIDHFERLIELDGDLSDEQRTRLLEIADRCPVHRTLTDEVKIVTTGK
jgi:putative redox protein